MRTSLLLAASVAALAVPCFAQHQLVAGEVPVPEVRQVPPPSGSAGPAASNLGVVPAVARTAFGTTNSGTLPFSTVPTRYQQVFLGSELPATHRAIALGLRQDNSTGAGSIGATIDVEMKVGYTTLSNTTLTNTFDSNFNAGAPLPVVPRGNFRLPNLRPTLSTDPSVFLVQFPFAVPFVWVQQTGRNLLIEIIVHKNDRYASFTYPLDAVSGTTANTARVYNSGFPNAPTGTLTMNAGLVMDFADAIKKNSDYELYGDGCRGSAGFRGEIFPRDFANVMGRSNNTYPFGYYNLRFQQVFLGSEAPNPASYTALHMRTGSASSSGGNVSLQIAFGLTSYDHTNLSTAFATNIDSGPLTTVFNGTFNFPTWPANTDPSNFGVISFPFTAPWLYIPAAGKNILMEVLNQNTATAGSRSFDNCSAVNATTCRLYATGPTATVGSITRNYGPVIALARATGPSQPPQLTATSLPTIGQSLTINLSTAKPSTPALCPIGSSNTMWGALPLPFDLTVLGAPGCSLLASLDGLLRGVATDATGSAQFALPIPNAPGLIGVTFYNQWLVFDAVNRLGLVLSNGGKATIGEQ